VHLPAFAQVIRFVLQLALGFREQRRKIERGR